jgi:hypothetical protein
LRAYATVDLIDQEVNARLLLQLVLDNSEERWRLGCRAVHRVNNELFFFQKQFGASVRNLLDSGAVTQRLLLLLRKRQGTTLRLDTRVGQLTESAPIYFKELLQHRLEGARTAQDQGSQRFHELVDGLLAGALHDLIASGETTFFLHEDKFADALAALGVPPLAALGRVLAALFKTLHIPDFLGGASALGTAIKEATMGTHAAP